MRGWKGKAVENGEEWMEGGHFGLENQREDDNGVASICYVGERVREVAILSLVCN